MVKNKNLDSWKNDEKGIRILKSIRPLKVKNNNNVIIVRKIITIIVTIIFLIIMMINSELKYTCQRKVGPLWHRRAFLPLEINKKYKNISNYKNSLF